MLFSLYTFEDRRKDSLFFKLFPRVFRGEGIFFFLKKLQVEENGEEFELKFLHIK